MRAYTRAVGSLPTMAHEETAAATVPQRGHRRPSNPAETARRRAVIAEFAENAARKGRQIRAERK